MRIMVSQTSPAAIKRRAMKRFDFLFTATVVFSTQERSFIQSTPPEPSVGLEND